MDSAGVVTYANAAHASITGTPIDEIVKLTPETIYERIHPDHAAGLYERLYEAIRQGARQMVYRYQFRGAGHRYIWREDRAYCFYGSAGALEQSWIIVRTASAGERREFSFERIE